MKAAMREPVLGLFAKLPRPGAVKTRLAAAVSSEWAARVAEAFLRDSLARLAALPVYRMVVFAPAEAEAEFADLVRGKYELAPQTSGDLGQRMETFIAGQLAAGAYAVVLVGADSPTLPVEYVRQAFTALSRADVVLGPAQDGGYYLVGCGRQIPPIFHGIAWSSSGVLAQTIDRLQDSTWRLAVLPPWYDVDTVQDWSLLRGHVAALRRAGIDPQVPHTEALLMMKEGP